MNALGRLVRAEIAASGPMSVARYMALCLGHPEHGYYMRSEPFGRGGDFITAPEISQMFGELIGLWAAQLWRDMGAPQPVSLVELGPGRGTLMADAMRAARAVPAFMEAVRPCFVETSPRLTEAQRVAVPGARHAVAFRDTPDQPTILIANEFFDALPIRQFHRVEGAWRERVVALDGAALRWALGPPLEEGAPGAAPDGSVLEQCPGGERIAAEIGARIARHGGGALLIDYGAAPPATGGGDTLQALRAHQPVDPLDAPGEADLTAHVDFSALGHALRLGGATVFPLREQGAFLNALGLGARASALARARPDRAEAIESQRSRLADPAEMGRLFKALAATGPNQPPPPGF